jgi:ribosomal protein L37AE/L43A
MQVSNLKGIQKVKNCEFCGKEFVTKDKRKIFCTLECGNVIRQRRLRAKREAL